MSKILVICIFAPNTIYILYSSCEVLSSNTSPERGLSPPNRVSSSSCCYSSSQLVTHLHTCSYSPHLHMYTVCWRVFVPCVSVCLCVQALMELGARVCTPKGPDCRACPLREHCLVYKRVATGGLGSHATEGKAGGSTQWTCIEGGPEWGGRC